MNTRKLSHKFTPRSRSVSQVVCLLLALSAILLSLYVTHQRHQTIRFPLLDGKIWDYEEDRKTRASVRLDGADADNGRWYNFSHPPLFLFHVYAAFLVDHDAEVLSPYRT